jgi:hypothetical protein
MYSIIISEFCSCSPLAAPDNATPVPRPADPKVAPLEPVAPVPPIPPPPMHCARAVWPEPHSPATASNKAPIRTCCVFMASPP